MGLCSSTENELELKITELEECESEQSRKIMTLYKELEIEKKKTVIDAQHIKHLNDEIKQLHRKYDTDIFVYMDTLDETHKLTKFEPEVNMRELSSHLIE